MSFRNGPWIIRKTRPVLKDGFIEVTLDDVTRPDGRAGNYATVRMKPGVSVLPVHRDGSVTLIRQFRYALRRERLECVCGGIDGNESPEETVRRELREEAGLAAEEFVSLGAVEMDGSIILNSNHLFIARGITRVETSHEPTEQITVISMPMAEAVEKVISGEIDHAPTSVLILRSFLWSERGRQATVNPALPKSPAK